MSEGFKKCPYCNRVIMNNATECKHCGANLVGGGGSSEISSDAANYSSGSDDFGFLDGMTYMFTDKNIALKWAGLALVGMLMVMPYLAMFGSFIIDTNASTQQQLQQIQGAMANMLLMMFSAGIMYGYMINCIRSITTGSGTYNLPSIKFIDDFWAGLKFYLSMIIFMIPVVIAFVILGIILAFMGPLAIFVPLLNIAFSLLMMVVAPAFMWIFAQKRYWTTFFMWGFVKQVMSTDYNRYIKALMFMFLSGVVMWIPIMLIGGILIFAFKANLFILSVAYSLLAAYGIFVGAYFISKSISADRLSYLP